MLKVEKLAKSYKNRLLFKNVDFEILPHSIHLLQGNNGVGKSTLFKILVGIEEQDAGKIETELQLPEVGYLAHTSFLYPQLSALENLKFWHTMHTKQFLKDEEYMQILEDIGLARFAHEQVQIFSRGMLQKLTIARLLAQKPKLFLLDEPSTGLDIHAKDFLIKQILKAKEEGSAIFWISHDVEKDRAFADYIHVLEEKSLKTIQAQGVQGVEYE